ALHRIWWKQLSILGSTMGTGQDFAGAYELVASGRARPVIDEVLPLEEIRVAHARLEAGEQLGKIVLTTLRRLHPAAPHAPEAPACPGEVRGARTPSSTPSAIRGSELRSPPRTPARRTCPRRNPRPLPEPHSPRAGRRRRAAATRALRGARPPRAAARASRSP